MKTIDKLMLVFGGLLFAVLLTATQPVGYYQAPVTQYTNDFMVYFAAGDPTISNHVTFQQKRIWIKSSATVTNDGGNVVSNEFVRGAFVEVPVYLNISTPTNNDYSVSNASMLIVTNCSTNALYFTGFSGGNPGQRLTLINLTGTNMYIGCTNVLSAGNNRIDMLGLVGGTYTNTVGKGSVEFIYDGSATNWVMISITY